LVLDDFGRGWYGHEAWRPCFQAYTVLPYISFEIEENLEKTGSWTFEKIRSLNLFSPNSLRFQIRYTARLYKSESRVSTLHAHTNFFQNHPEPKSPRSLLELPRKNKKNFFAKILLRFLNF
jgi:hypothetical protein